MAVKLVDSVDGDTSRTKAADEKLEQAKGVFVDVLIIGYTTDGHIANFASDGLERRDSLWIMETFKQTLLDDDLG